MLSLCLAGYIDTIILKTFLLATVRLDRKNQCPRAQNFPHFSLSSKLLTKTYFRCML